MGDLYEMLFSTLTPERKLLTAITNQMWPAVEQLISEGGATLVNAKLTQQDGKTALHLVCEKGYSQVIERLVAAGADVNATDVFGFTPLSRAFRFGKMDCVRILLTLDWRSSPGMIWNAQTASGAVMWLGYDEKLLQLLVVATPDLSGQYPEACKTLYDNHLRPGSAYYPKLVRTYLLTGNHLTPEQLSTVSKTTT